MARGRHASSQPLPHLARHLYPMRVPQRKINWANLLPPHRQLTNGWCQGLS